MTAVPETDDGSRPAFPGTAVPPAEAPRPATAAGASPGSASAPAAAVPDSAWEAAFARRAHGGGGAITAILAQAGVTDMITFSGGFPAPETFPADEVATLTRRLVETEPGVALQYSPTEGLPSMRATVADRVAAVDGHRPADGELMITSGGIDALGLVSRTMLDAGDVALVEAPTYLGGIMAFRGFDAVVRAVPADSDGIDPDALAALLRASTAGGGRPPKLLYTIPDHQNPTGVTLAGDRRAAVVELCRAYGVLIVEDVAYRELGFPSPDAAWLPERSLLSHGPDVTVQIGTFSKTFCPGVRLGWAAGPASVVAKLAVAKQNSDQCAGALGQRLVEEHIRSGGLDRQIERSRALYARRATLMLGALERHLPDGVTWTRPRGGFFTWLDVSGVATASGSPIDTVELAATAAAAGVGFVPGAPFHLDESAGRHAIRLAYSRATDDGIEEGVRRLGDLVRAAH